MEPADSVPRMRFRAAVAAVLVGVLAGCGSDDGEVVVFAASSLTDVFADLESAFEAGHPGAEVVVSYGGSSTLATQIDQGAPADVFAAADADTARRVATDDDLEPFATNTLTLVVEPDNPLGVAGLTDLARDDLVIVLAAPEVPVGAYAAEMLERAGIEPSVDSYEQNVRAVVGKVALGEADLGVVYVTDVLAADGSVDAISIPADQNVIAVYPIVALTDHPAPHDFVDFVLSDEGREVLTSAGFGTP